MRFVLALLAFGIATALPEAANAITVRLVPEATEVVENTPFRVDLVADLDEPVLGWGLDVDTAGPVEPLGLPAIGPAWIPVQAPDGDGLAGAAFPDSVSGNDVLLASLRFSASQPGSVRFSAGLTLNDLTEGFALDPSGFASPVFFDPAAIVTVNPIPEPGTLLLVGAGLACLSGARPPRVTRRLHRAGSRRAGSRAAAVRR